MDENISEDPVETSPEEVEEGRDPPPLCTGDREAFKNELEDLLNARCMENGSDTPDFMLAEYLVRCLENWNKTICKREVWHGRLTCPAHMQDGYIETQ